MGKVLEVTLLFILRLCYGQIFLQSRKRSIYFCNKILEKLFLCFLISLYFLFWGTCVPFLKIDVHSVLF